jgi:signal transduction histidine kinase/ActR/RegA family two-component response regulator
MQTRDRDHACVLILAPIGRDAATAAELLRGADLQPHVCKDYAELTGQISDTVAAVVLTEEGVFGKEITTLCDWVVGQPAWSDLPFIVFTSRFPSPDVAAWRQRLVSMLRNVSLLERPIQAITFRTAVQAAVRARWRQYEVRALLEAQRHAAAELEHLVLSRTQQLRAANDELIRQMSERTQIEESLRQAQKMEAIGQLTGGIAHDFNNLLMVVLGGLTMLERNTKPARREMLIHGIREAAQRGAALTRQLLTFSRKQSLQPQPLDLAGRIRSMRDLLERSLGGQVQVKLKFADDLWPVYVDPGELELVVLNLVVNARDAMPGGGTIRIHAENLPPADNGELQGDYVRLAVTDSGLGMTAEVRARAFEPFFTTKEVGKGSGLGLAQVYGFTKQSGGSVQIHSEVGQGTCISLLLPRSVLPVQEVSRAISTAATELSVQGAGGSVLLVEDNDQVAALVSEMLHELGYDARWVANGAAALETLTGGNAFDVVFSDIMMPGEMDGLELGRQIRLRWQGIPVLLTSGYAHGAVQRAESEGFRVLPKPYDLSALASALKMVREGQSGHYQ